MGEKTALFSNEQLSKFNIVDWGYTEELEPKSFKHFSDWTDRGDHGILSYLNDHRKEKRRSLKEVYPQAKSAIVFLFSYHAQKLASENFYKSDESNGLKVASYVTGFKGRDYHFEIADYLNELGDSLKDKIPGLNVELSLDIHPVLERDLAYRAGLGWFGKNSMLISRKHGSFVMIGSLILNQKLELNTSALETDHCGQCRACIDACPTDAIDGETRTLIADKCISTWTIELFKEGPEAPKGMSDAKGEIFGCDICQDVCPWNHRPVRAGLAPYDSEAYKQENKLLMSSFLRPKLDEVIHNLEKDSNRGFSKAFKETPLGRTGKKGLLKNLYFWKKP